jgi:hypothetical protein
MTRSGHPTAVPRRAVQAPPTLPKPQRTLICIKVRCGRARANLGNRHLCRDHRRAARRASVPVEETHYGRFEKWAVNKVPIGRYMAFVGSLLLAMLFIADWLLPIGPTQSVTSGEANKPTIRIKSDQDHKWPERIAFDTSAPTIVAQTPPVVADAPVTHPPREAFALLGAPVPEVSETPPPVRTKRKVAKRAPHSRWTAYQPAARAEAFPAGW